MLYAQFVLFLQVSDMKAERRVRALTVQELRIWVQIHSSHIKNNACLCPQLTGQLA